MKKKVYLIMTIAMVGIASFSVIPTMAQTDGNCDETYYNEKKQFLVSGCKPKEGYRCLLRCDQPNVPDISI
ncbi:hypothetical protein [Algoriphagus marinus]|uniref:hypothetical protein n=1 Tax=Algoriphagus marinus TaxID=1925762 RepID=UPI00094B939E|nr:hypothetical protein [Algoriphagus marinus]